MEDTVLPTIEQHFGDLTDPRVDRTKLHELINILVIAICAIIAGADNWEDVEEFGKARLEWFQTFLHLPNGIPSHDTFTRVFAAPGPEAVSNLLYALDECGQRDDWRAGDCH